MAIMNASILRPYHFRKENELDILNQLRHGGAMLNKVAYDSPSEESAGNSNILPMTVTQLIDSQIKWHEAKIKTLKEAKEAVSPEVERALNALAKL